MDFQQLASELLARSESLCEEWFPAGKKRGHEYQVGDLYGSAGKSLSINLNTGAWKDFASGEAGGDLIALYAAMEGIGMGEAYKQLTNGHAPAVMSRPAPPPKKAAVTTNMKIIMPVPESAEPPSMVHPVFGEPVSHWQYRDKDGDTLGYVARYEPADERKQIVPWVWGDGKGWVMKQWPDPRPLYGLELLAERPDAPVMLTEGEKDADAARRIAGHIYIVMTWPGGANAWKKADFSVLAGRKVLLWPDADDAGRKCVAEIGVHLLSIASEVKALRVDGDTGDGAADFKGGYKEFGKWARERVVVMEKPAPVIKPAAPLPITPPPTETIDHETGEITAAEPSRKDIETERRAKRSDFQSRSSLCKSIDEFEDLMKEIKFTECLAPADRELLAKHFQGVIKSSVGIRMTIDTLRYQLGLRKVGKSDVVPLTREQLTTPPSWAAPWVWRQDTDEMFHLKTKASVSSKSFDMENNRHLTAVQKESAEMFNASEFMREVWQVPIIDAVAYIPYAPEMFSMEGKRFANTYRPELIPDSIPVDEWSFDQRQAVDVIKAHIAKIIPTEADREAMILWLAHNVQLPGIKVNWAPLIVGTYGDGKSFFASMLGEVMGKNNVKMIDGNTLVDSTFNGYAEGAAVVAFEEVRVSGNHYDVLNKLKPLITNDRVSIHAKHLDPYTVPNVVNYMMFSNHMDAIPVDDNDRRYFIVVSPYRSAKTLSDDGMNEDYFSRLFDALNDNCSAVRGWLESIDLEGFNSKGRAPSTAAKRNVVEFCRADEELAIMDMIEEGCYGVSKAIFSSTAMVKEFERKGKQAPKTIHMNHILQRLGYTQLPDRIKWADEKHRVWVGAEFGAELAPSEARRLLDETRYL